MERRSKRSKTSENENYEMTIASKIIQGLEYNIEEFTTETKGYFRLNR